MKSNETLSCISCEEGVYKRALGSFESALPDGTAIKIHNLSVLKCAHCGDELIPAESRARIDQEIADQTESLSRPDLEQISETLNLTQTEVSQALGLGIKTFHRWTTGAQYPSRSMGYYLRVMAQFPDAFEWVKNRQWRSGNRTRIAGDDVRILFPDIDESVSFSKESLSINSSTNRSAPSVFQPECSSSKRINVVALFRSTKVA